MFKTSNEGQSVKDLIAWARNLKEGIRKEIGARAVIDSCREHVTPQVSTSVRREPAEFPDQEVEPAVDTEDRYVPPNGTNGEHGVVKETLHEGVYVLMSEEARVLPTRRPKSHPSRRHGSR